MARHNNLCGGVANLASKAFTTTYVREDPKIYTGRAVHRGKYKLKGYPSKDEGDPNRDILIIYLWT